MQLKIGTEVTGLYQSPSSLEKTSTLGEPDVKRSGQVDCRSGLLDCWRSQTYSSACVKYRAGTGKVGVEPCFVIRSVARCAAQCDRFENVCANLS